MKTRDNCQPKLQALVYDILPSTTAVFSYATGSRKLSANEQFFVGAQTVVSLLQTTQIKTRRVIYSRQHSLHQHKYNHNRFESRQNSFFHSGVDASHAYVRAWALGCFQSYQYPNLSDGAGRVAGQLRGDKECPFSGVTKSGRVWRKVPESDARSVPPTRKTKGWSVYRRQNNRMLRQCPARHCAATVLFTQLLSQRLCGTVTKTMSAPPHVWR